MQNIEKLLSIMATLRDGEKGCDWDKHQTFKSIVPHTLEEAYEVADAIEQNDWSQVKDELGDLLFQVIFYAQLGKEAGHFDFSDIVDNLNAKLVRRHPHVFATQQSLSRDELEAQWTAIKKTEKHDKAKQFGDDVPLNLPALSRAQKIQKRAANLGFDWPSYHGALDKVKEEVEEVIDAMDADPHSEHSGEELGDLLFATVNTARHGGFDAEQLLRQASRKFVDRFQHVEVELAKEGKSLDNANLEEMDNAWERVKKYQKSI
ncbi:Nucleoside triphosphate pyrophosphohydrolase MazG [Pseudoalteromonas luteoviolacea B = ATCC 29581]|nr:Nucleoside triphosphate pyrophosphohydrolase MazG [Pseudoalteromonas luteoviolacea B = ATCC 29581]